MRKVIVLAAAAALMLSACADKTTAVKDPGEAGGAGNAITVKAHEYMFDVSGSPKAGMISIEATNTGKEMHHAIVGRLKDGKTLDDVKALLAENADADPPEWFDDSPIDMSLLSPGKSATITYEAKDAGEYVLLCFMPAPDGSPHVSKGMMTTFTVAEGHETAVPKADVRVEMTEYAFSKPEVKAGNVTLEVANKGKENHDFLLLKFAEGKTFKDIEAWFESGQKEASPAVFYGGTHDFAAGRSVFFTAALDPGMYTLICGVETDDGKNHGDDLGMVTEFDVH